MNILNTNKIKCQYAEVQNNLRLFDKITIDETCNIKCTHELKINDNIIATTKYVDDNNSIFYQTIPVEKTSLFLGSLKTNRNYTLFILCLDPEGNRIIGSATLIITILENNYNIKNDTVFVQFTGRSGVFIEANITKYESERIIIFNVKDTHIKPKWIFVAN